MKYLFLIILIYVGWGCNPSPGKSIPSNDSVNRVVIKYPLPTTIDSLFILLITLPEDSNKVNVLNALGKCFFNKNPDTSIILSNNALILAQNLEWQKGIANSHGKLGAFYYVKSDYFHSMENYKVALKLEEDLGDSTGMAKLLGNIGLLYWMQGNFTKALESHLRALNIDEALGNKNGIAKHLGNIGVVYHSQLDYDKTLEYYFKALKLDEELQNATGMATRYGNIGIVYKERGDFIKALDYYSKAAKLYEELGAKLDNAMNLDNIGLLFMEQGELFLKQNNSPRANENYHEALDYFSKALKMKEEMGNSAEVSVTVGHIGSIQTTYGDYGNAYKNLYRALALADSVGVKDYLKYWYESLSMLYEKSTLALQDSIGGKFLSKEGMRLRALYYYKSYLNMRDTLFSEENKKQLVRKEMNYDFDKKEAVTKAENDKKEALAKEELKQKETERNYFIGGFALVLLLAGFIFRSYRQKQKANEIISHQKLLVEEKQKEILDSIHYAKRIQKSLLPTEKFISKNLNRLSKK